MRAKSDPGAHYLHTPGYREALKPSRKRHGTAAGITLSTEPVLMDRKDMKVEQLMPEFDGSDGLSTALLRMGPAVSHTGPDPNLTGGQYDLVVNGGMELATGSYSPHLVHGLRPPGRRAARVQGGPERTGSCCCCNSRESDCPSRENK